MTTNGIGKKELYFQNRLATGINTQQIQAWFPPVISADSGHCTVVAALARWLDDEHGWIGPATFIPMAESLGLISELGHQNLLASLATDRRWQAAGLDFTLAINVSKRQSCLPLLHRTAIGRGQRPQHPAHPTYSRITEWVAMLDVEHTADRLQTLKQAGFRITH